MRKLWCLVKVDFRAMLVALSFGRGKAGKAGGIGALVLFGGAAAVSFRHVQLLLAGMDARKRGAWLLMPVMTLLGIFMSLMLTMFGASGIVYGGRDMDLMLSLPVPAFSVMLAKLLALYLENLVFCGLWLIPTGVALSIYGGASAGFVVCMALAVLFHTVFAHPAGRADRAGWWPLPKGGAPQGAGGKPFVCGVVWRADCRRHAGEQAGGADAAKCRGPCSMC